jgi:hypothetical protein
LRVKNEGTRHATLTEGDRIVHVRPSISQSGAETRLDWADGGARNVPPQQFRLSVTDRKHIIQW